MSRTVWKFSIEALDASVIAVPKGAVPLAVGTQGDAPVLWVEVDEYASIVGRRVFVRGTGHRLLEAEEATYVGTFQLSYGFVGHVYVEDEQ